MCKHIKQIIHMFTRCNTNRKYFYVRSNKENTASNIYFSFASINKSNEFWFQLFRTNIHFNWLWVNVCNAFWQNISMFIECMYKCIMQLTKCNLIKHRISMEKQTYGMDSVIYQWFNCWKIWQVIVRINRILNIYVWYIESIV